MTLLDRYLVRRFMMTLLKVLVALILLVSVIDLVATRQEDISKYQIPWHVVLLYYVTFVPTILFEYQAAAVSVLISGLMVLGNAAQHNEITALLAGGVSLGRIARAPVVMAMVIAVAVFFFQESYGVRASEIHAGVKNGYFSKVSGQSRFGVSWTNLGEGWTCHVLKFNERANSGQDVFLHSIHEDRIEEIRAKRIFWDDKQSRWLLEDGRWVVFDRSRQWETAAQRITQCAAPFTESPSALFALSKPAQAKTTGQLAADIERARRLGIPVQEPLVNYHLKFSQPALCFVIIWLAFPFAMKLRRGGIMLGFGVSIGVAMAYLLVFAVSVGLGYMGKLPPWVAAWVASVLFLTVGIILFRRTPT